MKAKIIIFLVFFFVCIPLWAQTTEVEGTVKDEEGNPMPGVKVTFEHADIAGIKAHVTTNKRGEFYYPGLLYQEPGEWFIYPELEGYLVKHLKVESRDSRKELFTDIDSDLNIKQTRPEILCKPGGKVLVDFILVPRSYFEAPLQDREGLDLVEAETPSISSIQKARTLYDEGRIEESIEEYERSIEEEKDASICVEMSKILLELEREREAVVALRKALSLQSDLPMVHYALAHILRSQGDHEAALEELKQEMTISPDNAKVLKGMGEILTELGRDKEAIGVYHQIIEKNPGSSDAYIALASIYNRLGDFEKAEQAYRKVTELNPENADRIYYNVGVSIINKENLTASDRKRAEESFKKALELNPDYALAHLQLGYLLLGDGKMQQAKEHFVKYLELKPGSSEAETVKAIIESI